VASGAYQHVLSKKKKIEALEDAEKLLPIDTLGVVMITHGKEFSENSAFGTVQSIQHDLHLRRYTSIQGPR
jgi:hypothetical protein